MNIRRLALVLAVVVLIAVSSLAYYELEFATNGQCRPLGGRGLQKSQLHTTTFGAVTEYELPAPIRWSNAITVAPDGSVWFGEEALPGVGHLYPNGTLLEYPWPGAPALANSSGYETGIWGIALWNGMVWGANFDESELVGLDPSRACATVIALPGSVVYPYTMSLAPDGSLWFTSISQSSVLGRITPNLAVSILNVTVPKGYDPAQLQFVNSTRAYFVAISPDTDSGGVYSFDPSNVSRTVEPSPVGGSFPLVAPNSISVSGGQVWVAQHLPTSVAGYSLSQGRWTLYPTSPDGYTSTTLPYFIEANGSNVWFNEHYGNRIAMLDTAKETLTEFSESNPPVTNGSDIQNDLTIALGKGGLWFTSTTGNYIGFVSATSSPPFTLSRVSGNATLSLSPGDNSSLSFVIDGSWSSALRVQTSDSENATGVPSLIGVRPSVSLIVPGSGRVQLEVQVSAMQGLKTGDYTLGVTVTDGLVSQTAYVFVDVE